MGESVVKCKAEPRLWGLRHETRFHSATDEIPANGSGRETEGTNVGSRTRIAGRLLGLAAETYGSGW